MVYGGGRVYFFGAAWPGSGLGSALLHLVWHGSTQLGSARPRLAGPSSAQPCPAKKEIMILRGIRPVGEFGFGGRPNLAQPGLAQLGLAQFAPVRPQDVSKPAPQFTVGDRFKRKPSYLYIYIYISIGMGYSTRESDCFRPWLVTAYSC